MTCSDFSIQKIDSYTKPIIPIAGFLRGPSLTFHWLSGASDTHTHILIGMASARETGFWSTRKPPDTNLRGLLTHFSPVGLLGQLRETSSLVTEILKSSPRNTISQLFLSLIVFENGCSGRRCSHKQGMASDKMSGPSLEAIYVPSLGSIS